MKCQILFSRKNKKKIFQNVVCCNFYPACKVLSTDDDNLMFYISINMI